MRHFFILTVCLFYIIPATSLFAEYYQYVDKAGIKHFTDDISEVPQGQRPSLRIHQSIQTPRENTPPAKPLEISPESLVIEKDALDDEYEALVKKREDLNQQKKKIGEKKYNKMATQLNIEIRQYQEKSKAYEALVEKYNAKIRSSGKN